MIRTNVQLQPSQDIRKTLEPIVRESQIRNNYTDKSYTVPGDVYITQPYIQPVQQKEKLEVNWTQGQD